jgi:SAM-dependent methyltransferase
MDSVARQQFLADYAKIRHAEGRGSDESDYYRALPYGDRTGKNSAQWEIRARSFAHFARKLLPRIENEQKRPLDVLDLGAGNGWLSHRLGLRKHSSIALDIFCDKQDGLGALHHYPFPIPGVAAEFDSLPFADARFDLLIFNSSFHYSSDYVQTLQEARRCLRPSGWLVIMDSPLYDHREHGEKMRAERQLHFERTYGFRSEAQRSIEYLDRGTLAQLSRRLNIDWHVDTPWYGWQWALRPIRAKLRDQRPPSRFVILSGRFRNR